MRSAICALGLLLSLAACQTVGEGNSNRVILPNSQLLRCKSSECSQLWSTTAERANAIFPKQLLVDMDRGCVYGMTALYDKSVSVEEVKRAIDERYGKFALADFASSPVRLWRVEPEKFAIQLSVDDKKDERLKLGEEGTKRAIYIAFGGRSACGVPAS